MPRFDSKSRRGRPIPGASPVEPAETEAAPAEPEAAEVTETVAEEAPVEETNEAAPTVEETQEAPVEEAPVEETAAEEEAPAEETTVEEVADEEPAEVEAEVEAPPPPPTPAPRGVPRRRAAAPAKPAVPAEPAKPAVPAAPAKPQPVAVEEEDIVLPNADTIRSALMSAKRRKRVVLAAVEQTNEQVQNLVQTAVRDALAADPGGLTAAECENMIANALAKVGDVQSNGLAQTQEELDELIDWRVEQAIAQFIGFAGNETYIQLPRTEDFLILGADEDGTPYLETREVSREQLGL